VLGAGLAPLGAGDPLGRVGAWQAGREALTGRHKGDGDLFSVVALAPTASQSAGRLLPGMPGTMTLLLRQFTEGYVLPSTAVYSRGGRTYVLVVEGGVTRQLPVQVQVNDGRVAKVAFVTRRRDAAGVAYEGIAELT